MFYALLILVRTALVGTIPEEVGELTTLSWLNLSNNQLSGERAEGRQPSGPCLAL